VVCCADSGRGVLRNEGRAERRGEVRRREWLGEAARAREKRERREWLAAREWEGVVVGIGN
jgi:hypothetical protein